MQLTEAQFNLLTDEQIDELYSRFVRSSDASTLERDWRTWLPAMGPRTFTGEFAGFHGDFWSWYWPLIQAQQSGKPLASVSDYLTYLLMWGRGLAKSSSAEWAVIAAGALVKKAVVLYVSSTADLAVSHLRSIQERIEGAEIARFYKDLSNPRVGRHGNQYGWRSDMLATDSGMTVFAVGLEQEVRGLRVGDLRPTLIVFDDIDGRHDSPDIVKKKEQIIGGSILPAGTADTINLFAQNLIHSNSVATRIYKRYSELLNHRKDSGLIKSFTDDFEIEQQGTRFVVTKGSPTWKYFDMRACQSFIDKSGPTESYAEYQHDFERNKTGLVLKNWDDCVHVITWSEFQKIYGRRAIPDRWYKYGGNDWARTKSEFHCNVAGFMTVASQNEPLPGFVYLYDAMTFEAGSEPEDVALRMLNKIAPNGPRLGLTWESIVKDALDRTNLESHATDFRKQVELKREALAQIVPRHIKPILTAKHYKRFRGSHEQANAALSVYHRVFGLPFDPTNPGSEGGLDLWDYLLKVDYTREHPFKAGVPGYSRFFLIVDDDKAPLVENVTPDKLTDSDLCRYQFKHWRYAEPQLNAQGIKERGPQKMNDDFGNMVQMQIFDGMIEAAPLTRGEMVNEHVAPHLRVENLPKTDGGGLSPHDELAALIARREAEKKVKPLRAKFDVYGQRIN
jgi:hypothetical protein